MKNEKESYETLHIRRYFLSNCLVYEMSNLCFMRKNDEKSIIYYCSSLKCKNANGFQYQTLPLMGTTRPASVCFSAASSRVKMQSSTLFYFLSERGGISLMRFCTKKERI